MSVCSHLPHPVCELVEGGVQALFGPTDHVLGLHVHSICDALDIPHLETRPDLDLVLDEDDYDYDDEDEEHHSHSEQAEEVRVNDATAQEPGDISLAPLLYSVHPDRIATGWMENELRRPQKPARRVRARRRFAINLHPAQNEALLDVVQYLNWTRVAVVFEGNDGKIEFTVDLALCQFV